jgi:methanogenic corrinoid protein MtbC1
MKNLAQKQNQLFSYFVRFEHEIFLDTYEKVIHSNSSVAKETKVKIGENEIHHMIKYFQKIFLSVIYFEEESLLEHYCEWLYRVYYYRDIDLDFFVFLQEQLKLVSCYYISNLLHEKILKILDANIQKHLYYKENAPKKRVIVDCVKLAKEFAHLLLSGDVTSGYEFAKKQILTVDDFVKFNNTIITNAMRYIGYEWEIEKVSIAKEHVATATLEKIINKLDHRLPAHPQKDSSILLSSAPNELHGLGQQIATMVYEKYGYHVVSIGSNLPAVEIKNGILEFKPDVVLVSATLQSSLIDISLLVDDIVMDRAIFSKPFRLGIAGGAFERMANPLEKIKADFYLEKLKHDELVFLG